MERIKKSIEKGRNITKDNIFSMIEDDNIYTDEQFLYYVAKGEWAEVYSYTDIQEQINGIHEQIQKGEDSELLIKKAKKNTSKLQRKVIIDSIGRKRTVYVKLVKIEATGAIKPHAEAWARHEHQVKVQRMGKETSFMKILRDYGEKAEVYIREKHTGNVIGVQKKQEPKKIIPKVKPASKSVITGKSGGDTSIPKKDSQIAIEYMGGKVPLAVLQYLSKKYRTKPASEVFLAKQYGSNISVFGREGENYAVRKCTVAGISLITPDEYTKLKGK